MILLDKDPAGIHLDGLPKDRICKREACSRPFHTAIMGQLFCSPECAHIAKLARQRRYAARKRKAKAA